VPLKVPSRKDRLRQLTEEVYEHGQLSVTAEVVDRLTAAIGRLASVLDDRAITPERVSDAELRREVERRGFRMCAELARELVRNSDGFWVKWGPAHLWVVEQKVAPVWVDDTYADMGRWRVIFSDLVGHHGPGSAREFGSEKEAKEHAESVMSPWPVEAEL
jgi:hypothetical protein